MQFDRERYQTRLATSEADLCGAQRLRYQVFVEELGGSGPLIDHENRLERDEFDPLYDHLVLVDTTKPEQSLAHVVGAYRLLPGDKATDFGRYYSEAEYDLSVLKTSGRRLLELGRSCIAPALRGGMALYFLWEGLASYVLEREAEVLFGVASFHGTNVNALAQPLAHLHNAHLAPPELRVRAAAATYQTMDLVPQNQIDRVAAMRQVPALIKSYLRLGGFVGDGAYVDHAFNTTDVCLVMDTARMSAAARTRFENGARV